MTKCAKDREGRSSRSISKTNGMERAQSITSRRFLPIPKNPFDCCFACRRPHSGNWGLAISAEGFLFQICADCAQSLARDGRGK